MYKNNAKIQELKTEFLKLTEDENFDFPLDNDGFIDWLAGKLVNQKEAENYPMGCSGAPAQHRDNMASIYSKSRVIYWPHANQSLEVIVYSKTKRLYVQDWKGLVYRVFANVKELRNCLKNLRSECLAEFESEEELDEFLDNF